MIVELTQNAPDIMLNIEEKLNKIENPEECALIIKLEYYEANTLFYLKKITRIIFHDYYMEILHTNNSLCYLLYEFMQEIAIVNANDIKEE